jgi:hypothetical protein
LSFPIAALPAISWRPEPRSTPTSKS